MTKQTRRRGEIYPRLKIALDYLRRDKRWTIRNVAAQMANWCSKISSQDNISEASLAASLKNVSEGARITETRAIAIEAYFRSEHAQYMPAAPLDECFIDLRQFFHVPSSSLDAKCRAIHGVYQTYARPTSVNVDEIRRGVMRFIYQPENGRIKITERQYRPKSKRYKEVRRVWEGYCTPLDQMYTATLRTKKYHSDMTPLHYLFHQIDKPDGNIIRSMKSHSITLDPDRTIPSLSISYLERKRNENDCIVDFTTKSSIDQYIFDEIDMIGSYN